MCDALLHVHDCCIALGNDMGFPHLMVKYCAIITYVPVCRCSV